MTPSKKPVQGGDNSTHALSSVGMCPDQETFSFCFSFSSELLRMVIFKSWWYNFFCCRLT